MFYLKLLPFIAILLLSLSLFHQIAAQQQTTKFDPGLICSLIANGTKIKDPRYCNTYIECVNQQPISISCGDQFYDRNSDKCMPAADVTNCLSSDPCAMQPNGFTSDPYSCNGYYYCENGIGTRGECSPGMNFNPESMHCIRDFECKLQMYPEDYCNIIPDGVFIKLPQSCQKYQLCWKSQRIEGNCPSGFYFNAFFGNCDLAEYVHCEEETPQGIKCTEANTFISDGQSCNGYYYCQENGWNGSFTLIHNFCPENRFFVASNGGECVIRTETVCLFDRCITLGMESIQLANLNGDGCRGFSLCQKGQQITQAQCPEGEYFDEAIQLCTKEIVKYPACVATSEDSGRGSI